MRTLNDLTKEELTQVIENNPTFANSVRDMCLDYYGPAYCKVDEYLQGVPRTAEYSIDGYSDYFRFRTNNGNDLTEIADYCEKLQHDYCFFGDDDNAINSIEKLKKYAAVILEAENGYINMKDKDYNKLFAICETLAAFYAETIKQYCGDEYRYFHDIENCIDYCMEMEQLEEYRITDTLQLVNLEELQKVFKKQGLYWGRDTIENFMETALETMQNG